MPTDSIPSNSGQTPPKELKVSWEDYHQTVERLALLIHQSQWSFDSIICIARGGLRVGDILSRIYRKPLAILSAQSYGGDIGRDRQDLTLSQSLSTTVARLGPKMLLVDDLVDSGETLRQSIQWVRSHYGQDCEMLKSAALWCKSSSVIVPDYYVDHIAKETWISQPFEAYESYTFSV
ncbi:MAG: phosphoribosyltransferase family protein [Cyanobacteria bacterium P01_D01_bin.73]